MGTKMLKISIRYGYSTNINLSEISKLPIIKINSENSILTFI